MPFAQNIIGNATNLYQAMRYPPSTVQALAAATTIVPNGNFLPISASAVITLTATPTITAGFPGQMITLVNEGANAIIFQDQSVLVGSTLRLLGGGVLPLFQYHSMNLIYDSSLTAWIQLEAFPRQLSYSYSPDIPPTAPNAANDEFDGTSSATWVQYGTPDTVAQNTTYKGHVLIQDNDATLCGIYQAFSPGAATFTIAAKFSYDVSKGGFNICQIAAQLNTNVQISAVGPQNNNAGAVRNQGNNALFAPNVINTYIGTIYAVLTRDTGTTYTNYLSNDGINWWQAESAAHVGTVDRIAIEIDGVTGNATMVCDWFRVFTTQTTVIGSA